MFLTVFVVFFFRQYFIRFQKSGQFCRSGKICLIRFDSFFYEAKVKKRNIRKIKVQHYQMVIWAKS